MWNFAKEGKRDLRKFGYFPFFSYCIEFEILIIQTQTLRKGYSAIMQLQLSLTSYFLLFAQMPSWLDSREISLNSTNLFRFKFGDVKTRIFLVFHLFPLGTQNNQYFFIYTKTMNNIHSIIQL